MNNLMIYSKLTQHDKHSQLLSGHRFSQPAFAIISIQAMGDWGAQVYDHNFNKANIFHRYNPNNNVIYSSELANNWYSSADTSSYPSGGNNAGPGTSMVSHLGHNCVRLSPTGEMSFSRNNKPTQSCVGTWLHNSTPHLTINMENAELWVSKRSYELTDRDVFGARQGVPGLNISNRVGTISYNEKTKKIAILESNGTYDHRLNVWSGIKSPACFKCNEDFWAQLTVANQVQTTWCDIKPATGSIEDNYRGVIVLCDNDDVVVTKMIPADVTYVIRYVKTGETYAVPTSVIWGDYYTTTYGHEKGNAFGIRFQISNNGQYVIAYTPAYYYGSGALLTITDTATSKVLTLAYKDATYGYSFAPIGDIDFVMCKSVSADNGVGAAIQTMPMYEAFRDTADGMSYTGHAPMLNTFDTSQHGTDYPYIIPIVNMNLSKFINTTGKLG